MTNTKCIIKKRAWDNGSSTGLVETAVSSTDMIETFKILENLSEGESVHSIYIEGTGKDGTTKRYVFELKTTLTIA